MIDDYDGLDEYRDKCRDLGYVIWRIPDYNSQPIFYTNGEITSKGKKIWWSPYLSDAYMWYSELAAEKVARSMKYGNPKVSPRVDFHRY